jgi:hypothetical protein
MGVIHLWQEELTVDGDLGTTAVTLDKDKGGQSRLWYRFPASHSGLLSDTLDPFVVAALFTAMGEGSDLVVHGAVSPSLLRNLEEFMEIWAHWQPDKYRRIVIKPDEEREPLRPGEPSKALAAFSGGVDASFTVYRHRKGLAGRLERNVVAGVMVHGFDIPLEDKDAFALASRKAELILGSLDLELIPMATNFREINDKWYYTETHGAGVASCLLLLQGGYSYGLIGSTEPYNALVIPWGSNPITDRLLGSDSFTIIHDGAAYTRSEKISTISKWPEALKYLRVCWQGEHKDRNCGQCEKCIRTILNFRVLGVDLPECFERDVSDSQILRLRNLGSVPLAYLDEVLATAKSRNLEGSWINALQKCITRNRKASKGWRKKVRDMRNKLAIRERMRRILKRSSEVGIR